MGILIRIPRVPGIIGNDAFVVLWMGLALSNGFWEIWTITPASIFGLHPYSPGAISIPFLISVMIRLGLSYEAIVLILTLSECIIGTIGANVLGYELFRTRQSSFFFTLFYSFSHLFLRFTYYTISLRGPLLAVLPWFFVYAVKTIRSRESNFWVLTSQGLVHSSTLVRRYAAITLVMFLILLLIHGLALFLILYVAVVIGYYILKRLKNIMWSKWPLVTLKENSDSINQMTIEKEIMPQELRVEIQANLIWLAVLPERIPEMNDTLLMKLKEELDASYETYSKAFNAERTTTPKNNASVKLMEMLLERINQVRAQADTEIESRILESRTISVEENPPKVSSLDLSATACIEPGVRSDKRIRSFSSRKINRKSSLVNLVSWLIFILLIGGAYFVGTRILPVQSGKTAPFLGLSNSSLLGLSINLVVDYGIRLGLMSLFLPIGIISTFHRDRGSDKRIVHYILLPLVMFTLPMSTYASVLFLPVFGYYSVEGLTTVLSSVQNRWTGLFSLVFVLVFALSYQLLVVSLPLWILVLIASIVLFSIVAVLDWFRSWDSYKTLVGKNLRKLKTIVGQGPVDSLDRRSISIFLISVIIISLVTTEGLLLNSENTYLTNDEKRIINYLEGQVNPGITFVPTPVMGRRLEAYGFPAVLSYNDAAALYFGWTDAEYVVNHTHLSLIGFLRSGNLYVEDNPDKTPERLIYNSLFHANLSDPIRYEMAKEIGLEYVLVEKNETGYSDLFRSEYGDTPSTLLLTAPLECELVVECQTMSLFRLL